MTARILLLGANGQVGFELLSHLSPLGEIVAATRSGVLPGGIPCEQADLAIPGNAAELIARTQPNVVVNAAAYTAVDRAEDEPDAALRVNGLALSEIGDAARAVDALVVHYSTDYVFAGDGTRPYRENDAVQPMSAYGESKLAGERLLIDSGAEHVIFRTAWVYGARGQNFLRTMLRLGRERGALKVVDDQRGAPTPSFAIAAATAQAIARRRAAEGAAREAMSGLFHLAAAGDTTWCAFARAIFALAVPAGLLARAPDVAAIASHEFPTKATRPKYSVLDCSHLASVFGLRLPPWHYGLQRVVAELAEQRTN